MLLFGWSLLEGLGAALVLPAIVALVASNFGADDRPRAYGLVFAGGAIAVAVGPLIGGLFTTYWSWRYVFVGEVLILGVVLLLNRRTADTPPDEDAHLDLVGTGLSALGLGLIVYGILRAGTWGFVQPKPEAPTWLGLSPVIWLILGGGVVLFGFLAWEKHRRDTGRAALLDPAMLRVQQLRSGVTAFFFQYLIQAGLFFAVPLFLSIALGLSAIDTGLRILPLSITLVIAAVGVPKLFPTGSPRRISQFGFLCLFAGIVVFIAALDAGAGAEIVTWPMLLAGLGIGTLASQLGAVAVSSVPDEQSGEVGGLQNTASNLGLSIGTALAGAVLISALTSSFFTGIAENPAVPKDVTSKAQTELHERRPVRLRRGPRGRAGGCGGVPVGERGGRGRERRRPHRGPPRVPLGARDPGAGRAVLQPQPAERAGEALGLALRGEQRVGDEGEAAHVADVGVERGDVGEDLRRLRELGPQLGLALGHDREVLERLADRREHPGVARRVGERRDAGVGQRRRRAGRPRAHSVSAARSPSGESR